MYLFSILDDPTLELRMASLDVDEKSHDLLLGARLSKVMAAKEKSKKLVKYLSGAELRIERIEYGSKGFQDFLGIAKVVQEILKFVNGLMKIGHDLELSRLEVEIKKQELIKRKIDNFQLITKIFRENGLQDEEMKEIANVFSLHEDVIIRLASEGKLRSAQGAQLDRAA